MELPHTATSWSPERALLAASTSSIVASQIRAETFAGRRCLAGLKRSAASSSNRLGSSYSARCASVRAMSSAAASLLAPAAFRVPSELSVYEPRPGRTSA